MKSKSAKRLMSSLLTLMMVFGLFAALPLTAHAADPTLQEKINNPAAYAIGGTGTSSNPYIIDLKGATEIIYAAVQGQAESAALVIRDTRGGSNPQRHVKIINGTIKRGVIVNLVEVPTGSSLVLENVTIDGSWAGAPAAGTGCAVMVIGGKFTMENDAVVENNNSTGNGSGIYIRTNGTFIMNGGKIRNNIAGNSQAFAGGGGVYLALSDVDGGTFTMNGGEITGNSVKNFYIMPGSCGGGGVYVGSASSNNFTMTGGLISGNSVNSLNTFGGGVFVAARSSFKMSGGTISNNTAPYGGGIFSSSLNNLTISNAVFSGNTASRAFWMTDTADIATYNSRVAGVTSFSAPPAGNLPFEYALNNYDIYYTKGQTSNPIPKYTVTFADWDGRVIGTQVIEQGKAATAPAEPIREGYNFIGWDKDFSNITGNLTVTAQYGCGHSGETTENITLEPTCTTDGSKDILCADCGDFLRTDVIYSDGHDYKAGAITAPTCTEKGFTKYACSVCGDSYNADYVDETGHNHIGVVTDPTCTEAGFTTNTCSVCNDSYTDGSIPALGHNYSKVVTPMTPDSNGFTTYTCTVCGDSYDDDFVDSIPYDWQVDETFPPTCTEKGYTVYFDSYWNVRKTTDYVDALGHNHVGTITAPTCLDKGFTTNTCSRCGDEYVDGSSDALGHDYVGAITAPTCTERGFTTYSCSRCRDAYVDNYVDALGHDWDNGVVTIAPTRYETGKKVFTCKTCGDTYEITLPKLKLNGVSISDVFVEKLKGDKNNLTITITELLENEYSGEITTIRHTKTFSISNNAAGTYQVENYRVYVNTKGNTQIRECYFVD